MNANLQETEPPDQVARGRSHSVQVNGTRVHISDPTPSGEQILKAAGCRPAPEFVLLWWPSAGPTREIALAIHLPQDEELSFIAARDDGVSYFMLDDERYAWAGPLTGADVRRIGRVPDSHQVFLERTDRPDMEVGATERIPLEPNGVERLRVRKRTWKEFCSSKGAGCAPNGDRRKLWISTNSFRMRSKKS